MQLKKTETELKSITYEEHHSTTVLFRKQFKVKQ